MVTVVMVVGLERIDVGMHALQRASEVFIGEPRDGQEARFVVIRGLETPVGDERVQIDEQAQVVAEALDDDEDARVQGSGARQGTRSCGRSRRRQAWSVCARAGRNRAPRSTTSRTHRCRYSARSRTSWARPGIKPFRWSDGTFLDLFDAPEAGKKKSIAKHIDQFETRRFVLVGDTGERDPEIDADVRRTYGGRIAKSYLRNTGSMAEKALQARLEKVFEGLPRKVWVVFEDGASVMDALPE